ncbi:MAG: hypothetical protein ACYC9Q_09135 [Bacillota bacterium]
MSLLYLWRIIITHHHGYDGSTEEHGFVVAPDKSAAKRAAEEKTREPYNSVTWDIERLDEVDSHAITVDAAQRVAELEADCAKMREALRATADALSTWARGCEGTSWSINFRAAEDPLLATLSCDAGRAYAEEHERYREALTVIAEGPGARCQHSSVGEWAAELADAALRPARSG